MSGIGHGKTIGERLLKNEALAAVALLAVLLAASIFFYRERMLFIDAPHILFRIINDGRLQVTDFRYGSFISQSFPYVGMRLHLPLSALVILYSAGFYLFYLTVMVLLVYKYRNYGLAVLFGLYLTLFVSDTFYWPNNEVHQGIAWLMAAFAATFYMAEKKRPAWVTSIVFLSLFFLAIWTHPLVMFAAIYLWFFFLFHKQGWPFSKPQTVLYSLSLLLLSFLKFYQGMHHGYDSTKIEILSGFSPGQLRSIFTTPFFRFFISSCFTNYWLFTLLFITGLAAMARQKMYLQLAWSLAFVCGYMLLLCITFRDVASLRFYIESEYMPLSIICCAPFVLFVLPKVGNMAGTAAVIIIFVVRLFYIFQAAPAFTHRVALLDSINEKMKEKGLTKVIMPGPVYEADSILIMAWGAPVESVILSKLKGDSPQRQFLFLTPGEIAAFNTGSRDTFYGCWDIRPVSKINSAYFLVDTTRPYTVMDHSALMK